MANADASVDEEGTGDGGEGEDKGGSGENDVDMLAEELKGLAVGDGEDGVEGGDEDDKDAAAGKGSDDEVRWTRRPRPQACLSAFLLFFLPSNCLTSMLIS